MKIIHKDYIEKRLPVESPLPTQGEIKARMDRLFGPMAKTLRPVINPCAEETERIICQLLRTADASESKSKVIIYYRYYTSNSGQKKSKGYKCECGFDKIHSDHKYCPNCARRIDWRTPAGKFRKYLKAS